MSELMPCPFCPPDVSDPEVYGYRPFSFEKRPTFYRVCCSGCGTVMEGAPGSEFRTEEDAVAGWNARHERMVKPAVYIDVWITNTDPRWVAECGCGATLCEGRSERDVRSALPPYCSECGAKVVEE